MRVSSLFSAPKHVSHDERGAVAVIVALMLVVLLGMAALTVDLGGSLSFRRQMVAAADAAALAAARACANGATTLAAQNSAVTFAAENAPGTTAANQTQFVDPTTGLAPVCGPVSAASGSIRVGYQRVRDNVFAPILGLDTTTVGATATASWGALASGMPPPVLLAQNPFESCFPPAVRQVTPPNIASEVKCIVWFDNQDIGHGQWGFMNLDSWGISPTANCGGANPQSLPGWIADGYPTPLSADPPPVYVCLEPGGGPNGWVDGLHAQRYQPGGKTGIRLFPVTEDQYDIPGPGHPKVGVIGFAPVRIRFADWGSRTVPSGGDTKVCVTDNLAMTPGRVVALDSGLAGTDCPPNPASVDAIVGVPVVTYRPVGHTGPSLVAVPCAPGVLLCDYTYDPVTRTITWHAPAQNRVVITFTWRSPFSGSTCMTEAPGVPNPPPTGNSASIACVVISWPGPQTFSGTIGGTSNFGARAVDLTG